MNAKVFLLCILVLAQNLTYTMCFKRVNWLIDYYMGMMKQNFKLFSSNLD